MKALVSKCLEGRGLSAIEVQRRQDCIHSFLFTCYCNSSMLGDDQALAKSVARLLVKEPPKKRVRVAER